MKSLYDHCMETGNDLLSQWHPTENEGLTPAEVSFASNRKVWWRCHQGHEWQAVVYSRASGGSGCPFCSGRVALPGFNDLATCHPDVAAQWHPTKNGELTPQKVKAGARQKVWWICEQGHEWQAAVYSRASDGSSCPFCSGLIALPGFNDLASCRPEVAAQWHPKLNGDLSPEMVTDGSNKKVWWRCEHGHEWQAIVFSRALDGKDCPYCTGKKVLAGFNDLATVHPKIAAQWHPELNGELTPQMITSGSHKRVWWQCDEDHVWKAVVYSRTGPGKHGCPVCAGNVRKK